MRQRQFNAGRRAFLSGAPLTSEGRQHYKRLHRPLGPALPWLPDAVTAEICAGCEAPCVTACPTHIITRHARDHSLAGRPYLAFDKAGCNYCGECAEACPHTPEPATGQPTLGAAHLDTRACLAWNGVVCISCLPRCPRRALQRDGRGRVHVEAAGCNGCGECVSVCPADAIAVESA